MTEHEWAFHRLPILADALEEAGCSDPDILSHCRGLGPHVRGCWSLISFSESSNFYCMLAKLNTFALVTGLLTLTAV